MATKTVAEKGHVKAGTTLAIVNPVQRVVDSLGLPAVEVTDLPNARLVFLFVRDRTELESGMRSLIPRLCPGATLWVFFRKGSRASGLDMNRDDVWTIADAGGLRPLGLISVDDTWSAFRLRAPGG
jgi:hypothetical protein